MENKEKCVNINLANGNIIKIEPVTSYTFRIRLSKNEQFKEPPLIKYGIIHNDWESVEFSLEDNDESSIIRTNDASLSVSKEDGRIALRNANGEVLIQEINAPSSSQDSGFNAEFELKKDEKLYGLGDETREQIKKNGHRTQMWVKNVASYVPIPFLMSTGGWGIFLNTTWRHFFDLGHTQDDRLRFWSKAGELDYYLIAGESLPLLLDRYTDIAGKPHLLPLWGYGLTFVCNQQANAKEMLDDCLNFRREGIPCDLVGLEPGWMSKNYDFTVDKAWHPERFYIPHWSQKGPHTFLSAAARLGFKMSLWLCCDYDLSYAEEAQAPKEPESEERHPDDFEQDQHFGHNPLRMDKLTKPEESWFEHLKKFVDQGAVAFKMDGANQVNEHPDRKWGNGMDDEEMHNLYPTLLNKQMSQGFREHTGKRAMIYSSGGYTGIQKYSATWAGDTGGGPKPLVSILNHGLSGHSNASCDMDAFTPEGIHFGFLMAWSQLCSWAYWRHPWLLGDRLMPIFKFYARLRYRILPYIYSMAHKASRTGMPIMRSMNLMFPEDPKCDNCMQQYMFGNAFLVGAFTDKVYLPEGRWIDFWTGEVFDGKQEIACEIPEDKGGPLFIRAGAIVPHWPDMDYVGQKPVDTIALHAYPGGQASFTLYEDDGISYSYLDGAVATTEISFHATAEAVALTIEPRVGDYEGMPERRTFEIHIHSDAIPKWIALNAIQLAPSAWSYNAETRTIRTTIIEDPNREDSVVLFCSY